MVLFWFAKTEKMISCSRDLRIAERQKEGMRGEKGIAMGRRLNEDGREKEGKTGSDSVPCGPEPDRPSDTPTG